METWDDLSVFLALFRHGSASRAAAALGIGVSTVSRRLDRLEGSLGRPLFARTSEGVQPTAAGRALLPHATAVEHAILAGTTAVHSLQEHPEGEVVVALPTDMLHVIVLPVIAPLIDAFPGLQIVLQQGSGMADLMRLEADIAVRVVPPQDGDELVARRLRDVDLAVFARPSYLATLHRPEDPAAHRWITWTKELDHLPSSRWLEANVPEATIAMRSNTLSTLRYAAATGVGTAMLPRLFGQLTPTLVEVPLDAPPAPFYGLWLVTHRAVRHTSRVAPVWEFLVDRLRSEQEADDLEILRPEVAAAYGLDFDTTPKVSSS